MVPGECDRKTLSVAVVLLCSSCCVVSSFSLAIHQCLAQETSTLHAHSAHHVFSHGSGAVGLTAWK